MSFDLMFYSKKKVDKDKIFEYLKSLQLFKLSSEKFDKSCQFWYENEDTSVYFSFYLTREENKDKELIFRGFFDTGLSFNINLNRHSFFKEEAFPIVVKIMKELNLHAIDFVQKLVPKKYSLEQLKKSWEISNTKGIKGLAKEGAYKKGAVYGLRMKRARIEYIYNWQFNRKRMQNEVKDVEVVPNIFLFKNKRTNEIITLLTWSTDIPTYFPVTDCIGVIYKVKSGLFSKKDIVKVFRWNDVFTILKTKLKTANKGTKFYIYNPKNYSADLIKELDKFSYSELHKDWERLTLDQVLDEEYLK